MVKKDKTDGNSHKLYRSFLQGHRSFKTPQTSAFFQAALLWNCQHSRLKNCGFLKMYSILFSEEAL